MRKIDRLGWADGFVVSPFGARIGVRTNRADYLPKLLSLAEGRSFDFESDPECDLLLSVLFGKDSKRKGVSNFHLVYYGSTLVSKDLQLEDAMASASDTLDLLVSASARTGVFLAAGLVEFQGKTLLLPALSGTGRSSLAKAFEELGAEVRSEIYSFLDEDLLVSTYPLDKSEPSEPDLVVFTHFEESCSTTELKEIESVAGVMKFLSLIHI